MSRDVAERFADIRTAVGRCERYRPSLDDTDDLIAAMAYDAILRNPAVIGEAVRSLPEDIKAAEPATPWASIAGLRNIVIHEYFRVERELIADIVVNELQPLATAITRIAESEAEADAEEAGEAPGNAAGNAP